MVGNYPLLLPDELPLAMTLALHHFICRNVRISRGTTPLFVPSNVLPSPFSDHLVLVKNIANKIKDDLDLGYITDYVSSCYRVMKYNSNKVLLTPCTRNLKPKF